MRTSRPLLEKVINAGIRTVIYAGDADYICNYMGVEEMVSSLKFTHSSQFASEVPMTLWRIKGITVGLFKNAGSFSYVRIKEFVPLFEASRFKLTPLLPALVTLFLLTKSKVYHPEWPPWLCSNRRWLANRSPRRKYSD